MKEEKEKEQEIRRKVLEDMRLHFIFNTLNSIRFLIRNDQSKAYAAIYDLGKFLQGMIPMIMESESIALEEELHFVKAYLNLESIQKTNLKVDCQIQESNEVIPAGKIYRAAEELLKQDVNCSREGRTLEISSLGQEHAIKLRIVETDNQKIVFLGDYKDGIENNFGG